MPQKCIMRSGSDPGHQLVQYLHLICSLERERDLSIVVWLHMKKEPEFRPCAFSYIISVLCCWFYIYIYIFCLFPVQHAIEYYPNEESFLVHLPAEAQLK